MARVLIFLKATLVGVAVWFGIFLVAVPLSPDGVPSMWGFVFLTGIGAAVGAICGLVGVFIRSDKAEDRQPWLSQLLEDDPIAGTLVAVGYIVVGAGAVGLAAHFGWFEQRVRMDCPAQTVGRVAGGAQSITTVTGSGGSSTSFHSMFDYEFDVDGVPYIGHGSGGAAIHGSRVLVRYNPREPQANFGTLLGIGEADMVHPMWFVVGGITIGGFCFYWSRLCHPLPILLSMPVFVLAIGLGTWIGDGRAQRKVQYNREVNSRDWTSGKVLRTLAIHDKDRIGPRWRDRTATYWIELYKSDAKAKWHEAFDTISPKDTTAVPVLIELLRDDETSWDAAVGLERIGEPAVSPLVEVLMDKNRNPTRIRVLAANALEKIGPLAKAAVPSLTECLKDPDVALQASFALIRMGPEARSAVPTLIGLLKAESPTTRSYACSVLTAIGADGVPAISALTELLKDDDDLVRQQATRALGGIGPADATK